MFLKKEISKWEKNELLRNLLDKYINELFVPKTLNKLKKGEKIDKDLYNRLKEIFGNSHIIEISKFDSSIQKN